jgi:DNA-directed RNA polymerase specialized sigma24 family protein
MSTKNGLNRLNIDAIIEGCQAEATQPRDQESGYCFELFRRALEDEEPVAWLAIDAQYRQLLLRWGSDYAPDLPQEEIERIVPDALPKFWQSLTKSTIPLINRFAHIGALLKYLKQCTLSVLIDYRRQLQRSERIIRKQLEIAEQALPISQEDEQDLVERLEQEQLLLQIRAWIQSHVTDAEERQVLYLSYQVGLSPAQIAARYPDQFPEAQQVRRIKERILKRARRAFQIHPHQNVTRKM